MIPEILRHVATYIATRLVEGRLKADALTTGAKAEGQETWRLVHSGWYRFLWLGMTLLWAGAVGLLLWLWLQAQLEWRMFLAIPLFGGALVFSALAARDAFMQEIEVSVWGMTERRGGAVVAAFPWSEVDRVKFVTYLDSYRVIPRQGRSVRFSMHIQGLPRFKSFVRKYAPAEALEGVRNRISDLSRL